MAAVKAPTMKNTVLGLLDSEPVVIFYDLETTGLKPGTDRIIECSAIKAKLNADGTTEPIETKTWYINPGFALPAKITELTGITDEFLADKPSEEDVAKEIFDFFSYDIVAGYNNQKFDDLFMEAAGQRNGFLFFPETSIDVITMARETVLPSEVQNYKLISVFELFKNSEGVQFHNATDDVEATRTVFDETMKRYLEQPEEETLIDCTVKKISLWEKSNVNWRLSRIYVDTDKGQFFFDKIKKSWDSKTLPVHKFNLTKLSSDVCAMANVANEEELSKWKG